MKKTFTILILFIFATQAMAEINFDFSALSNGQPLYYKKTTDKEVAVVYPNLSGINCYSGYDKPTGDLIIPQTVTDSGVEYMVTIVDINAFRDCSSLLSVSIPNTVTSIGVKAFNGCSSLSSVTIGNSVTSIGNGAFEGCSSLASITIPNTVTIIDFYAFRKCSGLKSVTFAEGSQLITIGGYSFSYCSSLLSITIPNLVTTIDERAFDDCSKLSEINVEESNAVFASENGVMFNKDKTNLIRYPEGKTGTYTIPNTVTCISYLAFNGCSSLTSVTIGNSVTTIDRYAFFECSNLTSVSIGNLVTTIGNDAFWHCSSLSSLTIPNSVTTIGQEAFCGCSGLASVTIPNSVKSIDEDAFYDCSNATLYCEVEETSKPGGWNSKWNDRGGTVKWGCKVIRAAVNDEEYGTVATAGENYAVKGDDGSLWYLKETTNGTATLTATPNEGYHFVKWEEEPDAAATLTIENVTESKTYTAVFAKDEPTSIKNNSAGSVRKVTKVLGPDGLYIIKDGVKYNMLGEKVN